MRCAKCNCKIPTDEETWVSGEALCETCWKQSLRKTWGWTWAIFGIVVAVLLLLFAVPFIIFCVFGGILAGRAGQ
jgi:hypothetical protein